MSSKGVNSAGMVKVLPGSSIVTSRGIRSPRKLPVRAPQRNVLTPHHTINSMKAGSFGRIRRSAKSPPATITAPYPMSASIMPKNRIKKGAISGLGSIPS